MLRAEIVPGGWTLPSVPDVEIPGVVFGPKSDWRRVGAVAAFVGLAAMTVWLLTRGG